MIWPTEKLLVRKFGHQLMVFFDVTYLIKIIAYRNTRRLS